MRASSATTARCGALLPSSVAMRTEYGANSSSCAWSSRSPPSRQKSRHSLALRGLMRPPKLAHRHRVEDRAAEVMAVDDLPHPLRRQVAEVGDEERSDRRVLR